MTSTRCILLLATPLAAIGMALTATTGLVEAPRLAADGESPFLDADGDLLPDRLEWVLLLDPLQQDSDSDGVDDFLHAVQGRYALGDPRSSFGYDDEARVLIHSTPTPTGDRRLWVDMLFRFAGADPQDLQELHPYLDQWGRRVPITSLIGVGETHLALHHHPTEGLYAICSFELVSERLLRSLLPFTIGATAVINSRTISTGTFVDDAAGVVATLVPVAPNHGVVQALQQDLVDDPFWTSSRICVMQLSVISALSNGVICEVTDADCHSSGRLACPPTCLSSRGHLLFFPDGLATVTGGGF